MEHPIKISKFKSPYYLPHGLRFQLSSLHKIDPHLYSFYVFHEDYKYVDFCQQVWSRQFNGVEYCQLEMMDYGDVDPENYTKQDILSGAVKGGLIKIRYYKPVDWMIIKPVPLKWQTEVFLILSMGGDIYQCEDWNKENSNESC